VPPFRELLDDLLAERGQVVGLAAGYMRGDGRQVFPIFAYVLALNLVRARDPSHLLLAVVPRMALVGLVASVAYVPLAGVYPLNVMFTLAVATAVYALWRIDFKIVAASLFVAGGALVDYQWFGVACVLAAAYAIPRGYGVVTVPALFAVLLWPINGNWWALAVIPTLVLASMLEGQAGRYKWFFYAFYPAHLVTMVIIKAVV
jgi:hypothetical protein